MTRQPFVLTPQHFGALLFERATSRYLPFDGEATRLLRRCAEVPFDVAIAELDPDDRAPAFALVHDLHPRNLFGFDGKLRAELRSPMEVPADHLLGPLAVHLEVVAACNLRCTHCFAGELPRRDRPLTLDELDVLFADLARLGSLRLGLTGGEPLLRPDLYDVLDLATHHGLHPCLTTNATLLDERHARALGERELVWLNVSLEGASPETNDPVRGPGTFARVLPKLRLLAEHARFTLAFTLTSHNAHEAEACADLAREVGAHTAVFRPLYPTGVALDHPDLLPAFEDYARALEDLTACASGGDLRALDPLAPLQPADTVHLVDRPHCGAGDLVASVSVSGQVNPCSFLGADFDAGSLRERSFEDLWRAGHTFRRLRTPDPEDGFRGGCRARAQALRGSAFAADPWHEAAAERTPGRSSLANLHVQEVPRGS